MLSERTWRGESVIRLLAGLFILFCTGQLVLGAVQNLNLPLAEVDKRMLRTVITTTFMQGGMIALAIVFMCQEKLSVSEAFGVRLRSTPKALLLGIGAAIFVLPLALVLAYGSSIVMEAVKITPETQEVVKSVQKALADKSDASALLRQQIVFGISVILIAPIGEELIFRGILYPTFKQVGYPRLGLWVTSLLFAILHVNMMTFFSFLVLGIFLVAVYEASGNLLASITTHALFNGVNFAYMLYESKVNDFLKRLI